MWSSRFSSSIRSTSEHFWDKWECVCKIKRHWERTFSTSKLKVLKSCSKLSLISSDEDFSFSEEICWIILFNLVAKSSQKRDLFDWEFSGKFWEFCFTLEEFWGYNAGRMEGILDSSRSIWRKNELSRYELGCLLCWFASGDMSLLELFSTLKLFMFSKNTFGMSLFAVWSVLSLSFGYCYEFG